MIKRPMRPMCAAAIALMAALPAMAQPIEQRDLDRLNSDDLKQVQAARSSIITAISDPGMAVGNRLAASEQLIAPVREMIESGDENEIVNGLMIAGSIVTPEAIGLIESTYASEIQGVRYSAMRALRTSLRILGEQRTPSLQAQEVGRQIKAAGEILRNDPDSYVAEGAARALIQASKMGNDRLASSAEAAFTELAQGASARLTGSADQSAEKQDGAVRIAMMSTFELGRMLQGARRPGQAAVREAGALAGDSLAYVYKQFQAAGRQIGSIDAEQKTILTQLLGSSETLLYYARSAFGQSAEQTQLRANFDAGNDRDFNRNILSIIGGTGILTQAPFSLKADRFIPAGG